MVVDSLRINNMKYLITFILLLIVSSAEGNTPDWVLGKGHPSFDDSKYLVGVGVSEKSPIYASESARAELIKNIRVKINSVLTDYNSREKSVSESSIVSETEFLLEGSQVKDGWYDEKHNVFYSFVVVERRYVLETLKLLIDNMVASIELYLRQGDTFVNNGNLVKALVYYYDGFKESSKLLPYIQTYNSVILVNNRSTYKEEYNLLLKEKILNIVDNINLEKIESTINPDMLDLTVKASFKGIGINSFPMKFTSDYNRYNEKLMCDTEGQCKVSPTALQLGGVNTTNFTIKAVVDLQSFEKHFNHTLKKELFGRLELLSVVFRFKRDKPLVLHTEHVVNKKVKQYPKRYRNNDIDLSPLRNGGLIRRRPNNGHVFFGYRWDNGSNLNILKRW